MLRLSSKGMKVKHLTFQRRIELKQLCKRLKIRVRSLPLLDRALTHSSCREKLGKERISYERLEFLGDSILNASVSYILFREHPNFSEGKLSALRSSLVDEKTLAEIGMNLNILPYINLGKGETLSDSRAKQKVTADIMESIIAVIFIDRGFRKAFKFVEFIMSGHIQTRIENGTRDYKTRLQHVSIEKYKEYPVYLVTGEKGPDHNKIFEVEVSVNGKFKGTGIGRSKKEAEQKAAQKVLKHLKK